MFHHLPKSAWNLSKSVDMLAEVHLIRRSVISVCVTALPFRILASAVLTVDKLTF